MRRLRFGTALLFLSLLLIYAGFVLYPLSSLLTESLHFDREVSFEVYRRLLDPSNHSSMEAAVNTVLVSLLSVVGSGIGGVILAVTCTQLTFPLRRTLSKLAVLPVALPPLVGVIAFLFVFGESGILPRLLRLAFGFATLPLSLDGMPAIVTVHAYAFSVYFYLFVSTALERLDASVLEAAESFGASRFAIMRKIVLPELKPALLGASILTFMSSMASFSAPLLFAGEKRFLTLEMFNAKLNGELDVAAGLAVMLTLLSVAFYVLLHALTTEPLGAASTKGAARMGRLSFSRGTRVVLLTLAVTIVVVEMLPLIVIVLISFTREGSWTWQILPTAYTIENYIKLFSDDAVFQPIVNSLEMSALATAASILVGVGIAYLLTKGSLRRWRVVLEIPATLPYAVPGTVIAVSLILAYNRSTIFTGGTILVGTFIILPLAYFIRMFPFVVRSATASLAQVDDALLEAGEACGAGPFRRFRRILLPLIQPGIVSGGMLVMITALGEFVSSILLYTYANRPIAVEIFAQLRMYNFGAAAAYSVLLLVLILLLVGAAQRIARNESGVRAPMM
ncbi:MAG: iron ABC transporter permease [Ignavibacteria bacterium]